MSCSFPPALLTPAEHAARISAIADVLAAVTKLPASAPRKQIEGVIVAAFNAAYTARVVQTTRPVASPAPATGLAG